MVKDGRKQKILPWKFGARKISRTCFFAFPIFAFGELMQKISISVVVVLSSLLCTIGSAQNINVSTPFSTNTDSFGNSGSFGSFGNGNFRFNFARGSNRQSSTTTPSLTTQNGFGGTLFSGQVRPFVTGVIPVVGQGGNFSGPISNYVELPSGPDNGVTRALASGQLGSIQAPPREDYQPSTRPNYSAANSTATEGALSVKAIKAARQRRLAAEARVINDIVEAAQQLEEERKYALARSKYREALRQTKDRKTKALINALIKATRLKD